MEEEVTKNKSLGREEISEEIKLGTKMTPYSELDEEVKIAIECADEKKAVGLVALDLRSVTSFTEFFVIANGTNRRHVQAIADEIRRKLRKDKQVSPVRVEGLSTGEWVLLDYGDFIAHIFNQDARAFYDLERLWRDAPPVKIELEENAAE